MTEGAKADSITLQTILWGVHTAGIVLAYIYKAARPQVVTRIDRQEP